MSDNNDPVKEILSEFDRTKKSYQMVIYKIFFEKQTNGELEFDSLIEGYRDFYLDRYNIEDLKVEDKNSTDTILNIKESSFGKIKSHILKPPLKAINYLNLIDNDFQEIIKLNSEIYNRLTQDDITEIREKIEYELVKYYNSIESTYEPEIIANNKLRLNIDIGISIFRYGLTVPVDKRKVLYKIIGHDLNDKNVENINLVLNDYTFDAHIRKVNSENKPVQISYDSNNELKKKLSQLLHKEKGYIENNNLSFLPEIIHPEMAIKSTQDPKVFKMELITIEDKKRELIQTTIKNIKKYITDRGYNYPDKLIENFYLSLKSKPFVLLAGISGTGKTKLVKLFANALGCTESNDRFQLISVRPDWNDSSDLLGYKKLNGKFKQGPLINILKKANDDPKNIHIVCLDEMNLARVEYYFSDFLSKIETREFNSNSKIESAPLFREDDFENEEDINEYINRFDGLKIPENLYIVGTVNMDETTHPFSKKVLDRANTIEFNNINLKEYTLNKKENSDLIVKKSQTNYFLKPEYIDLIDCSIEDKELIDQTIELLTNINSILEPANLHVGYRVRDEIIFYLLYNEKYLGAKRLDYYEAFDFQLMQKILPRIQGSSTAIKQVIRNLYTFATGKSFDETVNIGDAAKKYVKNNNDIKYPRSAKKLAYMIKRMEEDRFTAYWL